MADRLPSMPRAMMMSRAAARAEPRPTITSPYHRLALPERGTMISGVFEPAGFQVLSDSFGQQKEFKDHPHISRMHEGPVCAEKCCVRAGQSLFLNFFFKCP